MLARANLNCDATTDAADVIAMLEASSGLDYSHGAGCPAPGDQLGGSAFGDANCDRRFDARDALALLLLISGMSIPGCG